MKKLIIILLLSFIFNSCDGEFKQEEIKVEFLFEKNGCKMYRFKDEGRYIYWSDCQGKTQFDYTSQQGKTRVNKHLETITTK